MSLAEVPSNGDLTSNYGRTSPPAKTMFACEPINSCREPRLPNNGNLPSNYGRTSPPAKTVLACEPINLCLWPRLPSNGNLPSNYGRTSPPAKTVFTHAQPDKLPLPARLFALAGGRFIGRGYLIMAIYPLTMAGLVPLPKQCSHVNQSTCVDKSLK